MVHIPLFIWIVLGVVPVVIALMLLVEAKVVKPSIEAELQEPDHAGAAPLDRR